MSGWFGIYGPDKVVTRWVACPEHELALNLQPGEDFIPGGSPKDGWVDNDGYFNEIPEQPSRFHNWDWTSKTWVFDRTVATDACKRLVDKEREKRAVAPIESEVSTGVFATFDADEVSQKRISGTISRLERGDGLPVGWLGWRDYDNQMHWASETAAYVLASLSKLARNIENREQSLLITAWTLKANLENLTDQQLIDYDAAIGW